MSENDVSEIKESLSKIWDVLRQLQLDVAKNYVTKVECEKSTKGKVPAWMAYVFPFMTLVFGWLLSRAFPV